MTTPHRIIGWKEYVAFPDWGISALPAKIDSGARSSALHVEDINPLSHTEVEFYVVLRNGHKKKRKRVVARIARQAHVRSSTGHYSRRYFVRTSLKMGDWHKSVEVNLVDRGDLRFRLLVGRTALPVGVLIDVNQSYVFGRHRRLKSK